MNHETFTLFAASSSGDSYEVTISFANGKMSVICSCPAGSFNQWCKHKTAFLTGDDSMLFDSSQKALFDQISELVTRSKFPAEYENLQTRLKEIENVKKRLSKQATDLKNAFAKTMREGI